MDASVVGYWFAVRPLALVTPHPNPDPGLSGFIVGLLFQSSSMVRPRTRPFCSQWTVASLLLSIWQFSDIISCQTWSKPGCRLVHLQEKEREREREEAWYRRLVLRHSVCRQEQAALSQNQVGSSTPI